jgi:hypothetical protein
LLYTTLVRHSKEGHVARDCVQRTNLDRLASLDGDHAERAIAQVFVIAAVVR